MKFELEEIKHTENVAHAQEEQYAVILGLFPIESSPWGNIAWFRFALGFDYFHALLDYFHTGINSPRGRKNWPGFAINVDVANIES